MFPLSAEEHPVHMHLGFIDARCLVRNAEIEAVASKFMAANSPESLENISALSEIA